MQEEIDGICNYVRRKFGTFIKLGTSKGLSTLGRSGHRYESNLKKDF
jgi:hypothetical protein